MDAATALVLLALLVKSISSYLWPWRNVKHNLVPSCGHREIGFLGVWLTVILTI